MLTIAIDGPAASGKGTLAKRIAAHYGLACLDTGLLYRAVGRDVLESGGSLEVSHDIESSYRGAHVVYAKSWGALPYFGNWAPELPIRERYRHFIVDEAKMALTDGGLFSHCLPLRRNVKATDGVMDAPYCFAIDEAENRLHVQKAVMTAMLRWSGM